MLRLNVRRTELTGFVTREENYAPGFFRVPFKHGTSPRTLWEVAPRELCFLTLPHPPVRGSTGTELRSPHRLRTTTNTTFVRALLTPAMTPKTPPPSGHVRDAEPGRTG